MKYASEFPCTRGLVGMKDGRTDIQAQSVHPHPLLSEGCGFALAAVIDLQKISVVV
jgi:hypothetical protein